MIGGAWAVKDSNHVSVNRHRTQLPCQDAGCIDAPVIFNQMTKIASVSILWIDEVAKMEACAR